MHVHLQMYAGDIYIYAYIYIYTYILIYIYIYIYIYIQGERERERAVGGERERERERERQKKVRQLDVYLCKFFRGVFSSPALRVMYWTLLARSLCLMFCPRIPEVRRIPVF